LTIDDLHLFNKSPKPTVCQQHSDHDATQAIMESSAAASTLTRQRLSVAVLSLAATATLGYFC
jgi:hypothetical protein